ncbi:MAG: hypothetical protein KDI82_03255 [Gammaproteobacteria bacterium]|nr:hypothetical protein [Gammaproteobacteria bacterium]
MIKPKHLLESAKMLALFSAIALVVWSMPERNLAHAQSHSGETLQPVIADHRS